MFNIYISFTIIFNVKIQLNTYIIWDVYIKLILSAKFLQNFFHTPYYITILFMVQDQHGLQSQIRHWENCWLEIISPELMFEFLISLTSISQCQSKGQLLLMWLEIIPFFSAPDTWLKLAAWKSLNWNPVFKSFFDQTNYHHIYTQSMHVVLA